MQRARTFVVLVFAFLCLAHGAHAQTAPLQYQTVAYDHDTGLVSNTSDQTQTVISFPVIVSGAEWLRLYVDTIELGDAVLRVTSYKDGDVQELRARHCVEWQNSTCYFNGNAVQVEVEAPPHSGPYRLALARVDAGELYVAPESQCGPIDDRVLSNDPRVGRIVPVGCTGWIIDAVNRGMLTAGHCNVAGFSVVQFNVPPSDAAGNIQMPSTNDQYAIDVASIQSSSGGVGSDWAYFGTAANPNTNLSAGHAQGWCFDLADPPTSTGNSVQITGYGVDTTPQSSNQVQQTHVGALISATATTIQHQADTEGANSGSPILWTQTRQAVGIHTHGGCQTSAPFGNNSGTSFTNAGLQMGLDNPEGTCRAPKVISSSAAADDSFGGSASISGDTALIGSDGDDDSWTGWADMGSAYVFVRDGSTWSQEAKLLPSDGFQSDYFGAAVSISGDTAIVGAPNHDFWSNLDAGSAYIFTRSGSTWTEQAELTAYDSQGSDYFGSSVSVSGGRAIVGANADDENGFDAGAAYAFVRSGATWQQQTKLLPSDGSAQDNFGHSVSISGSTAIVGAPHHNLAFVGLDAGSVYLFIRGATTWSQQAKLVASDAGAADYFGYSVAISGDSAIVGAFGNNDLGADSGAAYVFMRSGSTWSQQAKLVPNDGAAGDEFGGAVSISGDTAIVSAVGDDSSRGSAYVFVREGSNWIQQKKLLAHDGAAYDEFASSVAISGNSTVVGSTEDDSGGFASGSAYMFSVPNDYASIYCTAEINSQGCLPAIRFSGTPSVTVASPFKLIATSIVNNKTGQFFYGKSGRNTAPYFGGTLCVASPLKRGPPQNSAGTVGASDCTGVLTFDFNDWLRTGHDSSVLAGMTIDCQFWYRDPADATGGRGTTNAVEFEVLP